MSTTFRICAPLNAYAALVKQLTDEGLNHRRQTVAIVSSRDQDIVESHNLPADHVVHVVGDPTSIDDLARAGIDSAATVIVLADDSAADKDARTLLTVLQVEKHAHKLKAEGARRTDIQTIAELADPGRRDVLKSAHADLVVCGREFDEKILVQSVLNPGLSAFLQEVLTVDTGNEIIEVPVRGDDKLDLQGRTFDEALSICRERKQVLLLAIHRGGAPGVGGSSEPERPAAGTTLRKLIANPFSRDELAYRIAVGDSLLFLAESEKPLEDIFGDSTGWHRAFMT